MADSANNNHIDNDWDDIIQITDRFLVTNVALKADGKIIYGDLNECYYFWEDEEYEIYDSWLSDVDMWSNIIEIDSTAYEWSRILAGVDSDGVVHSAMAKDYINTYIDFQYMDKAKAFMDGLSNVKRIRINCETNEQGTVLYIYVSALDDHGNMHIYTPQKEETIETDGVKDFWVSPEGITYVVDKDNKLRNIQNNKAIIEGVLYVNEGFCVTQSGTIYDVCGNSLDRKTIVKDVWLER